MAGMIEGTPTLPSDENKHISWGIKDDQGDFWFPTADSQHSLRVALWSPTGQAILTQSNPGIVESAGSNTVLLDSQVVFPATTTAGTANHLSVNLPAPTHPQGWAYIAFVNPSTVSDMTLTFENEETYDFSGTPTTLYAVVSTVTVPANTVNGVVHLVQGWLLGDGARLTVTNVSTTEATQVTCSLRVRKV